MGDGTKTIQTSAWWRDVISGCPETRQRVVDYADRECVEQYLLFFMNQHIFIFLCTCVIFDCNFNVDFIMFKDSCCVLVSAEECTQSVKNWRGVQELCVGFTFLTLKSMPCSDIFPSTMPNRYRFLWSSHEREVFCRWVHKVLDSVAIFRPKLEVRFHPPVELTLEAVK